eukprot:c23420_g1_i1.p1 GENE.c23420_g1_i1~~c23420_g1_i1.p1  ORF type:complete len:345 (+),score=84.29 c23420_g1_i1:204-1238(+)
MYKKLVDISDPQSLLSPPTSSSSSLSLIQQRFRQYLYIPLLVVIWVGMNIAYSIWHKRAVALLNLPLTLAAIQLAFGPIALIPFWFFGIRERVTVSRSDLRTLFPIGLFHMINHVTSSVSLATAAVSFSHTVKAAEPAFTCVASALFLKSVFPWQVYVSLIPIMGGVALSSTTEASFSVASLVFGIASNMARAARAIASKLYMTEHASQQHQHSNKLSPTNLYTVMTCIAFLCAFPLALVIEGPRYHTEYQTALTRGMSISFLCECVVVSGLMSYQDVSFLLLAEMHPVSHAVGNVFKGVAVIVVSVLFFGNHVTMFSGLGCVVTVLGTLCYVLAKNRFVVLAK